MKNNGTDSRSGRKKRDAPFASLLVSYIIPCVLGAAAISAGIWGCRQKSLAESRGSEAEKLAAAARGMYEEAFTELTEAVYNIHIRLSKLLVSESPAAAAYTLNEIQRESGLCAGLMGKIPQSHIDSNELNGFLIRIGDYANSLLRAVLRDKPISDADRKQLLSLCEASEGVYDSLREKLNSGEFPAEGITPEGFFSSGRGENEYGGSGEGIEFPTLIYDGPFSQSAEKLEPRGVTGGAMDKAGALEKARHFLGDENAVLALASVSNGKIPSFDFEGELSSGRHIDIGITVRGGHLLFMKSAASTQIEGVPSARQADCLAKKAADWLSSVGYGNMRRTSAQYYSGCALISFAALHNGIILYNDLVKVWLDRATGEIIGADARDYLFSHTEREFPERLLDIHEAQSLLSPALSVKETQLALIPLTPLAEALCYEFRGSFGNAEYLVYIDAVTGEEQRILRVISDEYGEGAV